MISSSQFELRHRRLKTITPRQPGVYLPGKTTARTPVSGVTESLFWEAKRTASQ